MEKYGTEILDNNNDSIQIYIKEIFPIKDEELI